MKRAACENKVINFYSNKIDSMMASIIENCTEKSCNFRYQISTALLQCFFNQ